MTELEKIRELKNLSDLAIYLGYTAKGLSYILYKDENKYHHFDIPKKNGKKRKISAPNPRLKDVQKRLANKLSLCQEELMKNTRKMTTPSHGFVKGFSIFSNARIHTKKRYVLNIDLEDFFPSINFGRVRGFFIKNKYFKLSEAVSTIIAQIACYENSLPQGSPCSPIIANLIAHSLDMQLIALAKKYHMFYTRYADDLTFSSNVKTFPSDFINEAGKLGNKLVKTIEAFGFKVNQQKVRVSHRSSRQEVTGLVVNEHINTKKEYYRLARSLCHSLFFGKECYVKNSDGTKTEMFAENVEGIINFIYETKSSRNRFLIDEIKKNEKSIGMYKKIFGKDYIDQIRKCEKRYYRYSDVSISVALRGIQKLYAEFLIWKYFIDNKKPVIITEGKTDIIYIKCAIKQLKENHRLLYCDNEYNVFFLNPDSILSKFTELLGGTDKLKKIIDQYKSILKHFRVFSPRNPIIIVCDDDNDGRKVVTAKDNIEKEEKLNNLYVITIPHSFTQDDNFYIEKYFSHRELDKEINGKKFNPANKGINHETEYSKQVFATKVIYKNRNNIDFSRFDELLSKIEECIKKI